MPYRLEPIITGEIYHVFNRGVEKRDVFTNDGDYKRFYKTLLYYQNINPPTKFSLRSNKLITPKSIENKAVEIISFCLMPNHFHFLLKQLNDRGIATFIGKLTNSYTRYFNTKYKRVGHLFQGPYKAVRIETDEQLLHVSRYIHLNPFVGGVTKNLRSYKWSSYLEFLNMSPTNLFAKQEILSHFHQPREENYEKFVLDQIDYARSLNSVKNQLLE